MIHKAVVCLTAMTLVTLVYGTKHDELLALGYEHFPRIGYYYFGTGVSWREAQTICMASDSKLAVINSEEETDTLLTFLNAHVKDAYVYGGFTNAHETQYVTTDGIPLKYLYTKWEAGKPTNLSDRCGAINTSTGELTDVSCDDTGSYICEHNAWTDYTFVDEYGYYKLHTEGKGWADAYDVCESEGAHLLVIDTKYELDAVMKIYNEYPNLNATSNSTVYIGFRAVMEDMSDPETGTYLTIFGASIKTGYVAWYTGTGPIVGQWQFCGALDRVKSAYMMTTCDRQYAFFCEKELQAYR